MGGEEEEGGRERTRRRRRKRRRRRRRRRNGRKKRRCCLVKKRRTQSLFRDGEKVFFCGEKWIRKKLDELKGKNRTNFPLEDDGEGKFRMEIGEN